MTRTFSRAVACAALVALSAPLGVPAQTADPVLPDAKDIEACAGPGVKSWYGRKDDGSCFTLSHDPFDWSRYAHLRGRGLEQTLHGGALPGGNLTLYSTRDPKQGAIFMNAAQVFMNSAAVAIGSTSSPSSLTVNGPIDVNGSIEMHGMSLRPGGSIRFGDGTELTTANTGGGVDRATLDAAIQMEATRRDQQVSALRTYTDRRDDETLAAARAYTDQRAGGVADIEILEVLQTFPVLPPNNPFVGNAECPNGARVIGGGYDLEQPGQVFVFDVPVYEAQGSNRWFTVRLYNRSDKDVTVRVRAICFRIRRA